MTVNNHQRRILVIRYAERYLLNFLDNMEKRLRLDYVAQNRAHFIVFLVLVYGALSLFSFRAVVFQPGAIGMRNDWKYTPFPGEAAALLQDSLSAWSDRGVGSPTIRSGGRLYYIILHFISLVLGIDGAVLTKILSVFSLAGAGFFSFVLIFSIVKRGPPAFAGSLLYMFSPLLFNLVVLGYDDLMISYAFFPLLIWIFQRSLVAEQPVPWIIATAILFSFLKDNVQVASLLIVGVIFLFTIFFPSNTRKRSAAKLFLIVGTIAVLIFLLQSQFIVPVLMNYNETRGYVQSIVSFSWNRLVSPGIFQAFTLDGAGTRYFIESVPPKFMPAWIAGHIALFTLALSTVFLRKHRREAIIWSIVALVSLFLFEGSNLPFGAINTWLFDHVFLLTAFRNLQYITILTNLALAVLIAIFLASLPSIADRFFSLDRVSRTLLVRGVFFLISLALVIRAFPFLSEGSFNGEIQTFQLHQDYDTLVERFENDPRDGRVLLLPPTQPVRYQDNRFSGLDPISRRTPSVIYAAPSQPIQRLITMLLYGSKSAPARDLLCASSVHTVVARKDFTSETPRFEWEEFPRATWTNERLEQALSSWEEVSEKERMADNQTTVYSVKDPCRRLEAVPSASLSTGTLSDMVDLAEYLRTQPHYQQSVRLYTSQLSPSQFNELPHEAIARVEFSQNNLLDVTRLFLPTTIPVNIRNTTRDAKEGFSPLEGWWWKDWHWAAVLDPSAIVSSRPTVGIAGISIKTPESYELWIKAMQSRNGSELKIHLNRKDIKRVSTRNNVIQGLFWSRIPLGQLQAGDHTLEIETAGGENLIADMFLVPERDIPQAEYKTKQYFDRHDVVSILTLETRNLEEYPGVFGSSRESPSRENIQLPVEIPRDGLYDITLKVTPTEFIEPIRQTHSDYLDTMYADHSIGQTFSLDPETRLIQSYEIKVQSRRIDSNSPSDVAPDEPLSVTTYALDEARQISGTISNVTFQLDNAPTHDQWKLLEVPLGLPVNNPTGKYMIELSSSGQRIGWAAATVSMGYNGVEDYYPDGALTVNGEPQAKDLLFSVKTRVGDPQSAVVRIDEQDIPVPITEFATHWQNIGHINLSAGDHIITVPAANLQLKFDQIVLSTSTANSSQTSPPLAYQRPSSAVFTTKNPLGGGTSPYFLVQRDRFHDEWAASMNNIKTGENIVIPSQHHLKVDGYANAWWVNPPRDPYNIRVQYLPQRVTQAGLLVGFIVLFGCVITLLWYGRAKLTYYFAFASNIRYVRVIVTTSLFLIVLSGVLFIAGENQAARSIVSISSVAIVGTLAICSLYKLRIPVLVKISVAVAAVLLLIGVRFSNQYIPPANTNAVQQPSSLDIK